MGLGAALRAAPPHKPTSHKYVKRTISYAFVWNWFENLKVLGTKHKYIA